MANNTVLAVAEVKDGTLRSVSQQVVSAARAVADKTGGTVVAVAVGGPGSGEIAVALAEFGAQQIVGVEGVGPDTELVDARATALAAFIKDGEYGAVIFAATADGKDLAPRVAAKLRASLLTDVTEIAVDGSQLVVTRPVYAGKALAELRVTGTPALLSIRPNVFAPVSAPREAAVETVKAATDGGVGGYRVVGFEMAGETAIDVAEAAIIVSGGRGMKGPENWPVLEELREALGETAALGASRAVVDAGWRPHAEQVGQTGKTVTPKLYFAVGISGAVQHLAGMRTSGVIVAINRDADAPIFSVADYGIVGDLFEVVPKLAEAIRLLNKG